MTDDSFRKRNADSLIQGVRKGILVLQENKEYPNDPSLYEVVDINRSMINMMGKKSEDLIGKNISDIINLKEADLEMMAYVNDTGDSQQFEYYVDRLEEWLLISIHHSRNNFMTVTFDNITDEKETAKKLVESERIRNLTLEVTGEGVWEWTIDGKVKHNKQWGQILGLGDKYLVHSYKDFIARVHPEDRKKVMDQVYYAMETQEVFHHQYRMVRRDGSTIWVEDRGVAVLDEDGHFERMLGSMREITQYIEVQRNLNLEKEIFRSTLLSVGDGVIATDVNGNITIMNPVAEEFSGCKQSEVMGVHIEDIFQVIDPETKEDLYRFKAYDKKDYTYKRIQNKQATFTNREGVDYVMDCSISPIRLSDNKLKGFVVTFRDITEVVAYQKEIEYMSYHDELTGLNNRRFVVESIEHLDRKDELPLTIMVIDINNLKETNDEYGHFTGDHLIVKTSEVLKAFFEKMGVIARTGGDEFLIVLPRTSEVQAEELKLKVYAEVSKHHVKNNPLSVAIGYATKRYPEEDLENTLRTADDRMYQCKRVLKNTEKM